jgi:hypothetical protein
VGAHSLAALITLEADGRLVLAPHPDLAAACEQTARPAAVDLHGGLRMPLGPRAAEVTILPVPGTNVSVSADTGELARIEFGDDHLRITRPNLPDGTMPIDETRPLIVLIDADIVEVYGGGGYGAFRIGAGTDARTAALEFSSTQSEVSVRTF